MSKKYIDAHTHLCANEFDKDFQDVVDRAKQFGVEACLVVAEHAGEFEKILQLADQYAGFCLPCFGVHPVQGDPAGAQRSVTEEDLNAALPLLEAHHEKLVAIGEVGLDFLPRFCKGENDKESQRQVLKHWVAMSKKYDLPLNVHSRSAGRPTIALLKEAGAERVLLHAFDGKPGVAMEGVQAGYYFSIPPSIVRSNQKQKLVAQIPLDQMLLETDSPALGPEKQVRNEPANIHISCEYIAQVKKTDVETVARITRENAIKLFPKIARFIKV